jgi:hypothetical protein
MRAFEQRQHLISESSLWQMLLKETDFAYKGRPWRRWREQFNVGTQFLWRRTRKTMKKKMNKRRNTHDNFKNYFWIIHENFTNAYFNRLNPKQVKLLALKTHTCSKMYHRATFLEESFLPGYSGLISNGRNVLFCTFRPFKMRPLLCLETLGANYPLIQRHIPE